MAELGELSSVNMLTDEAAAKIIDKVTKRYSLASGYWSPRFDYNRKLLRDYRMELEYVRDDHGNVIYPYRSKVFAPLSFEKREIMLPQVVDAIFSKWPFFSAAPSHPGQDYRLVKKTEILLASQLKDRKFMKDALVICQEALDLGTSIVRLKWKYETRYVNKRWTQRFLGMPIGVGSEKVMVKGYDGPDFVRVPFYRFFIDPNTPPLNLQAAQFIIEEDVLPWKRFKEDADYLGYDNIAAVEQMVGDKSHSLLAEYDERNLPSDEYARDVRLLYYYDYDEVVTLAVTAATNSGGIIVKRQKFWDACPNGEYPYYAFHIRLNTDDGAESARDADADIHPAGFYPMGDLQPMHGMQAAYNTSLNQRIDTISLGLNPPLIVAGEGLEDEDKLIRGWEPARIMHMRDSDMTGQPISNLIWQVPIRDSFGQGWANQMEKLETMTERAMGSDIISGQANPNNETATGIMQMTTNAVKRISLKIFVLTKIGFEQLLTAMSDMNADMIQPDTVVHVTDDPNPMIVNPEDVVRGCSMNITASPFFISKQLRADSMLKLMPIISEIYPYANAKRMAEIVLENQEYIEDVSEIIPKDAPPLTVQQVQEMKAMQQAQMEMMKIAAAPQAKGPGASGTGGPSGNISKPKGLDSAAEVNAQKALLGR